MKNKAQTINYKQLIKRVLLNPSGWNTITERWVCIKRLFGIGSQSAIKLCIDNGFSPHEMKSRRVTLNKKREKVKKSSLKQGETLRVKAESLRIDPNLLFEKEAINSDFSLQP